MPGSNYEKVLDLAADQFGYVSTSQAVARGVSNNALRMMATRGVLERVSRGVYRLPTFPASPFAEYMEASLWPAGVPGVISHDSALAIRDLSDVNPPKVHITLPRGFRVRRDRPGAPGIHNAELSGGRNRRVEGIPTTTVRTGNRRLLSRQAGPTLLRQAIEEGEREGYLKPGEARVSERWCRRNLPVSRRNHPIRPVCFPSGRTPMPESGGWRESESETGFPTWSWVAGWSEVSSAAEGPRFTIKGAVALEMRLPDRARATKGHRPSDRRSR